MQVILLVDVVGVLLHGDCVSEAEKINYSSNMNLKYLCVISVISAHLKRRFSQNYLK